MAARRDTSLPAAERTPTIVFTAVTFVSAAACGLFRYPSLRRKMEEQEQQQEEEEEQQQEEEEEQKEGQEKKDEQRMRKRKTKMKDKSIGLAPPPPLSLPFSRHFVFFNVLFINALIL
ncbi:uncharacterized protein G2W53_038939 [Senna tora]|uniref:Uncharacterized protein n=1 Tax=Senna tora TaxID=362788 RepID=A0A834W2T7_9FABA|nr:uncharacterized protein G2W53_038939 [Senna tora]